MTFQIASRVTHLSRRDSWAVARGWRQRFCSVKGTLLLGGLVAFTGCTTAYTLPPLAPSHPAHLEAATPAALPVSNTLAYSPSDVPSPQPALAERQRQTPASQAGRAEVVGEGKVIATVPSSQQIVIDHKEIKGFMDAMTMGYRVDPPSILEGLNAGDAIRFTLDTQKRAIVKIEPATQQAFVGEGKVVAVVPSAQQIVIDHGDIKGLMNAMTMGFKVDKPSLLEAVQPGDRIRFTIGAPQNAIIQIERLNP